MPVDPLRQRFVQRRRHDHPRIHRRQLGVIERNPQAQAGWTTAVLHALLEVEHLDLGNRAVIGDQSLQISPDIRVSLALLRHDQQHRAIGPRQQLAIEQVGAHGILNRDLGTRYANRPQLPADTTEFVAQLIEHRFGIEECVLVIEQHLTVADRNHIVMEYPLINDRRVLLTIDHAGFAQTVQPRNGA